jgi:hypothetical protein
MNSVFAKLPPRFMSKSVDVHDGICDLRASKSPSHQQDDDLMCEMILVSYRTTIQYAVVSAALVSHAHVSNRR